MAGVKAVAVVRSSRMAERGAISLSARLQPFYTALLPVRCSLVASCPLRALETK